MAFEKRRHPIAMDRAFIVCCVAFWVVLWIHALNRVEPPRDAQPVAELPIAWDTSALSTAATPRIYMATANGSGSTQTCMFAMMPSGERKTLACEP